MITLLLQFVQLPHHRQSSMRQTPPVAHIKIVLECVLTICAGEQAPYSSSLRPAKQLWYFHGQHNDVQGPSWLVQLSEGLKAQLLSECLSRALPG